VKQLLAATLLLSWVPVQEKEEGFVSLFNGKDLAGWKANESPETFKVEDGKIIANGNRSHLFYVGDVKNHDFKNFELKAQVLCKVNSNSGIYFHTAFQDKGWPDKGFECQVCANGYKDPRKTGSLYAVKDVAEAPSKDDEWFDYHIIVKGKSVTTKINGKVVVEWTQPDDWTPKGTFKGRSLSSGTFALQGHDPGSRVEYKNIRVKPLDD
jgi:3-keto-disaccharide hydrolase